MVSVATSDKKEDKSTTKFERLPDVAKPTHYDLKIKTNLTDFTTQGWETISLEILKPTSQLTFYAKGIEIKSASIKSSGKDFPNLSVCYNDKRENATVELPTQFQPGPIALSLIFNSKLGTTNDGFYRSVYKDADGNENYLASTQFESTYARRAFPCWDEPIYKAKFDITLLVDEKFTALSNMNVISESVENGWKTVKFATTPIMSSYLVAFCVGNFEYIQSSTKSGVEVRVYAVPGKKDQCEFAMKVAVPAIDWYNEWFGIDFPLPKCDLIGIPDFNMGAMENWGLVTYREAALLLDPSKTSYRTKSGIALIVAHELAHMWFGNLVTMKWWTDLWLKEGFASFMEYYHVNAVFPELKTDLQFLNDELARGMSLDALKNSHPIEIPIENPNELDEIYDGITYSKGNSVNRMLWGYLGDEVMRKGLRLYLQKYQYSNAETKDLWNVLSEASNQDVNSLMSAWTKQIGFPVVSVTQRQDGKDRILNLSQSRFLADGSKDPDNLLWQIPINIAASSDLATIKDKLLLTEKSKEVRLSGVADGEWIKLNAGSTGYYRVAYSNEMLQSLIDAIKSKQLTAVDRFGLVNDVFALVRARRIPASQFLSLLSVCSDESEYVVWASLDGGVDALNNVFTRSDDPTLAERFEKFICSVYKPLADRLGWEAQPGEDPQLMLTRSILLGRLGKFGDQKVIATAKDKFQQYTDNGIELNSDLRRMIYGLIGQHEGMEGWQKLKKIYETCGFPEIEVTALMSMARCQQKDIFQSVFDYGAVQKKVRSQDFTYLVLGATDSKEGQEFLWNYFRQYKDDLAQWLGGPTSRLYQAIIKMAISYHSTESMAAEVEDFFLNTMDCESARTLDRPMRQSVEKIRLNASLLAHSSADISDWLKKNANL